MRQITLRSCFAKLGGLALSLAVLASAAGRDAVTAIEEPGAAVVNAAEFAMQFAAGGGSQAAGIAEVAQAASFAPYGAQAVGYQIAAANAGNATLAEGWGRFGAGASAANATAEAAMVAEAWGPGVQAQAWG